MDAVSYTSFLGCLYCHLTQVVIDRSNKVYMGYLNAVEITRGFLKGHHKQMVRSCKQLLYAYVYALTSRERRLLTRLT
jgi:hypothetical protein